MKEINYGDVFKIRTTAGKGYFQYLKEEPHSKSQLIRILPGVYRFGKRVVLEELVEEKEVYFVHFCLKDALKKRRIKWVGNYDPPEDLIIPRYFRLQQIVQGEFISWQIINMETQEIRPVKELTAKEKTLSPANIWNVQLLAERMASGWLPKHWK